MVWGGCPGRGGGDKSENKRVRGKVRGGNRDSDS